MFIFLSHVDGLCLFMLAKSGLYHAFLPIVGQLIQITINNYSDTTSSVKLV